MYSTKWSPLLLLKEVKVDLNYVAALLMGAKLKKGLLSLINYWNIIGSVRIGNCNRYGNEQRKE